MKAELLFRERVIYEDGSFAEIVIWRVPSPVPPSAHNLKYRLVYIADGVRVIGYDNERGKGDHRHFKGKETAYGFSTFERLMAAFEADVIKIRGQK